MKTTTVLALVLSVSACAPLPPYVQQTSTASSTSPQQAERECQYQVELATVNIRSAFEQGWEQARLTRECMALRGYVRGQTQTPQQPVPGRGTHYDPATF